MKSLLSPHFRLDWSREKKIFVPPTHPGGRCGCDATKPCVAAGDHVLMCRFTDRLLNNRFDPIALFGGKRRVRLKCCEDYMEINIGLIK